MYNNTTVCSIVFDGKGSKRPTLSAATVGCRGSGQLIKWMEMRDEAFANLQFGTEH